MAPNNNRGMTYQNDEKHLTNLIEYFVGGVNVAFNCLNIVFYYVSLTDYHSKYLSNRTS
jgi:hypothetical protein